MGSAACGGQTPTTSGLQEPKRHDPQMEWESFGVRRAVAQRGGLYDVWGTDANNVWAVGGTARSSNGMGAFGSHRVSGTTSRLYRRVGDGRQQRLGRRRGVHYSAADPQMERERLEPQSSGTTQWLYGRVGDGRQQRLGRRRWRHDPQMERERLEPAEQRHDGTTSIACGGRTPTTSGPWAGDGGTILKWNGSVWSPQSSGHEGRSRRRVGDGRQQRLGRRR